MRVERVLALVLLGGTGTAGCIIVRDPPPRPAAPPPQQARPAVTMHLAQGAPAPAPAPATTSTGRKLELHLGAGGTPAPAPPAASPAAAPAAPAPTPALPAGACFDQTAAAVPDCSTLQAQSPACPAFSTAQQKCAAYKNNFDAKVAAAAVSCLASSTCDATRPLTCAKAALAQACPDPNVAQLCQIAAGPCKSTAADCTAMLSGLNSQGQQAVAQCVGTGCSAGLSGCVDALK